MSERLITDFRYRPEVDGLRGVAVAAVVLYHLGFGCPGGYVGVDVFFVISGYLITSLIWSDLETGRFSFAGFWERRARRIVPALVAMALVTMAAGWWALLPEQYRDLGIASAAQAAFAANFRCMQGGDYFRVGAEIDPLLHTWSLAVEEQFYLLAPLVLWYLYSWVRVRERTHVAALLAVCLAASLAVSASWLSTSPEAAFYMLPSRAWELLLGALLAIAPGVAPVHGRRWVREVLATLGLALIAASVLWYGPETPFPGLFAVPPCLGAALIVLADRPGSPGRLTFAGRTLASRPLVAIGLISYSLYLWHWPMLALLRETAIGPISAAQRAAVVVAATILAWASWRFVETPFRRRKWGRSRASMYATAAAGLAAVLLAGTVCWRSGGLPGRFSRRALTAAHAEHDREFLNELSLNDVRNGRLTEIGKTGAGVRPSVLVWGDSHAMAAMPGIDLVLREQGVAGRAATHSMVAPVLDWYLGRRIGLGEDAIAFNAAVLSHLREQREPIVVLCGLWRRYRHPSAPRASSLVPALLKTIRRLRSEGATPYVMLTVPIPDFYVPRALARSGAGAVRSAGAGDPSARSRQEAIDRDLVAGVVNAGGIVIDPKPAFLDPTRAFFEVERDGAALYCDPGHLTATGARRVLAPVLRQAVRLPAPERPRGPIGPR